MSGAEPISAHRSESCLLWLEWPLWRPIKPGGATRSHCRVRVHPRAQAFRSSFFAAPHPPPGKQGHQAQPATDLRWAVTSEQGHGRHSGRTPGKGRGCCPATERTLADPTFRPGWRPFAAALPRCRHRWAVSGSEHAAWGPTRVAVWALGELMRFLGVEPSLPTLRGHSVGNQTLRSRLGGPGVFVQTGLPIWLAGLAGGRARRGRLGRVGAGMPLRLRAMSLGIGARARWGGSPSFYPPPSKLSLGVRIETWSAATRGWARAGPLSGRGGPQRHRGACSRFLLGVVASRALQRPAGGAKAGLAPVWGGGGGLASCRGAASGPAFAFYGNNAAGLGFLCPLSLGARPLAARGRGVPEVGRAVAAAPGGPAVTAALFCVPIVRHG